MPDDDVVARMKHHVQGVLANLSAMMPCFSLGGYKLPKVTGKKQQSCSPPLQGITLTSCSLHHHHLGGSLEPPPCPTTRLRAGCGLPPQP